MWELKARGFHSRLLQVGRKSVDKVENCADSSLSFKTNCRGATVFCLLGAIFLFWMTESRSFTSATTCFVKSEREIREEKGESGYKIKVEFSSDYVLAVLMFSK